MKKLLALLFLAPSSFAGTVTGTLSAPNSISINNATMTLTLSQAAVVSGTAAVSTSPVYCYTSAAGQVVGIPNPLVAPSLSANYGSGTLSAGTYYVKITYTGESLPSPESVFTMTGTGTLIVNAPSAPVNTTGYKIYISSATGTETLQGTVVGSTNYSQTSALANGAALPSSNTSSCSLRFNDELIPSFTSYSTNVTTSSGAQLAGYPQKWYLYGGSAGTVNLSQGTPLFNGVAVYPQAIVSNPNQNAQQSINGPLNMNGFAVSNLSINACIANGMYVAGSPCYATIQAAITAAGTTGSVIIPASYAGTDAYSNSNGVAVLDFRNGTNTIGIWNILQASSPVNDSSGNLIPLGNDINTRARGAADNHIATKSTQTTSNTSVGSTGVATITVGSTANLYSQASIIINRFQADEETLALASSGCPSSPSTGTWCLASSTTITANFQKTHTSLPYTVDQWGIVFLDSWLWAFVNSTDSTRVMDVLETQGGSNRGFTIRGYTGSTPHNVINFGATDSVPRSYGKVATGWIHYGSDGSTGTCGPFRLRNNATDDTQVASIDTCSNGSFNFTKLLFSGTAPTITGAGCGGSAASIATNNGTAAFSVNVGTAPTTACTVTLPTAANGWNCYATDITTNSTTVFLQKQSGGSTTTAIITNYNDVAVAANFTASDIVQVSCFAR